MPAVDSSRPHSITRPRLVGDRGLLAACLVVLALHVHVAGQVNEIAVLEAWDADGFSTGDGFGRAIAAHGDVLAVGAPSDSELFPEHGSVYVFRRTGSAWIPWNKLHGGGPFDTYGYGIATDGQAIVAGAPGFPSGVIGATGWGDAFVSRRVSRGTPDPSDDIWGTDSRLSAVVTSGGEALGAVNDIGADWVVVGREGWHNDTGAVELYTRQVDEIEYVDRLTVQEGQQGDSFGASVSLDIDVLAVAAWAQGDVAVHVFRQDGLDWQREATITPISRGSGFSRQFIDVSRDRLIIGGDEPKLYRFDNGKWSAIVDFRTLLPEQPSQFGPSVLLDEGIALVGTPTYRSTPEASKTGAIYVFRKSAVGWVFHGVLTPSDTTLSPQIGQSLAATDHFVLASGIGGVWVFRICPECSTLTDFRTMQNCFGRPTVIGADCTKYDYSGDGVVNVDDYLLLHPAMTGP